MINIFKRKKIKTVPFGTQLISTDDKYIFVKEPNKEPYKIYKGNSRIEFMGV